MKHFIVVAGNIGVGKSSLTSLLTQKLGWQPVIEEVEDNPYLIDFYQDMSNWSFHSQLFFLLRRVQYHHTLTSISHSIIQERSIYEDAEIFAHNLYTQGHINSRDWQVYQGFYEMLTDLLPPPDLVVYLQASIPTLISRITTRGRNFEHAIKPEYLSQLNNHYERWATNFTLCPVLPITTDDLDFVHEKSHLEQITQKILDKLQVIREPTDCVLS